MFNSNGTPNNYFNDGDDLLSHSTVDSDDLMEKIRAFTNKFCRGGNTQYAIRAFWYSFATGSIASWVQFFGKAVGVLISVKYLFIYLFISLIIFLIITHVRNQ